MFDRLVTFTDTKPLTTGATDRAAPDHVRRFFLAQRAPRATRAQGEEKQIPERTWKAVFGKLWELADDTEKLVLFRAFDRNKLLDLDVMYKLTHGEIVNVAARQVESKPAISQAS